MKTSAASVALAAAFLTLPVPARAQKAIFVVRHAEKVSESDQRLTEAGRARAARLAQMLRDSEVTAIFATDTERARDTAKPLAEKLGLKIELYDVGGGMAGSVDAKNFAGRLAREHSGDVVLVVAHSNTIPELLKALGCAEAVTIAAAEYDNLFVIVPKGGGPATLVRLRY
jgi:broad specificity phosphatase PhoE